jgi:hypothetical protein
MGILLKLLLMLLAARLLVSAYRSLTRGRSASGRARPREKKRVRADDIVDAEFEDAPGHRPGDPRR